MTTRVNKLDIGTSGGTSFSFNGGVCNCIIVKVAQNQDAFLNPGVGAIGITYSGLAMTKLAEIADSAQSMYQIWGLKGAPSGTHAVVVTLDGVNVAGASISVESYNGISRTATFPNTSAVAEHHLGSGSLTDIQVDVNTTEDDCILVGLGAYQGPGITYMSVGVDTALISVSPPGGGALLSLESDPLVTGVAGTYHLDATTGGGSGGIVISLLVVALTPGPASTAGGDMFLVF